MTPTEMKKVLRSDVAERIATSDITPEDLSTTLDLLSVYDKKRLISTVLSKLSCGKRQLNRTSADLIRVVLKSF